MKILWSAILHRATITKPKVHAKYVKLTFLFSLPFWIAAVNRPQNGSGNFIKPVSDSTY